MAKLRIEITPSFSRDVKKLNKKHVDVSLLYGVVDLISENSDASLKILKSRHKMHSLTGKWQGSCECHICNYGDWLLVWYVVDDYVLLQRTGSHDDIFR